ncbi:dihydrofolate reductase [Paracoccus sp. (in: a-proteobacteria)]|uniref:dihydrofolate reductase n=1 Tax=Paracoccus sp. TaxID=267 RepID=UPI00321FDC31
MLTVIVARARSGAIGKANAIPWHAPEDLAFFRRETLGGAVIMGRRTWDSLPVKPLGNRDNIIVSTTMAAGGNVLASFAGALARARALGHARIYAMGGAAIYRAALPLAHRLLITEVELDVEGADTFFPPLAPGTWTPVGQSLLRAEGPRCVLHEYLRAVPPGQGPGAAASLDAPAAPV